MIIEYFVDGSWNPMNGRNPIHSEYIREKEAESDEWVYKNYIDPNYVPEVIPSLIEVIITKVSGAVKHNSDFTWVTVALGKDIPVEFDLAIGEARTFAMTLTGQEGTPPAKFFAIVDENGKGKVTLNFDAMGDYVYTNAEANKGLATPMFFTKPILIEVGKATGGMLTDSGV